MFDKIEYPDFELQTPDYKAAFGEMTRLVVIAQRKLDNGKVDEAQEYLERANKLAEVIYNSPQIIKR